MSHRYSYISYNLAVRSADQLIVKNAVKSDLGAELIEVPDEQWRTSSAVDSALLCSRIHLMHVWSLSCVRLFSVINLMK